MRTMVSVLLLLLGLAIAGNASAQNVTCATANTVDNFAFTGGMQTFTMPSPPPGATVSNLHIEAHGAQGGSGAVGGNSSAGGAGALGGLAEGDLATPAPGTQLFIFVGGQGATPTGGFNGGGNGGSQNAGGGGGASDVRLGGTTLADRILIGGGGGGGGRGGC